MSPSKKLKVPRLREVQFTRAQFMKLRLDERELLIRVGWISNDVLLFQRLWAAMIYRQANSQLAKEAQAIHCTTMLVMIAGKVFEAIDGVFVRRFLSSPIGRDYTPRFSMGHRKASDRLKSFSGSSGGLAAIRNTHSFHYANETALSPQIEQMPEEQPLSIFLGAPDGNTMNPFASHAAFLDIQKITGEATPAAALEKLQNELGEIIEALFQWTAAVQLVAIKTMLGPFPKSRPRRIEEGEYLPQDEIVFPFFMSVATNYRPKHSRN